MDRLATAVDTWGQQDDQEERSNAAQVHSVESRASTLIKRETEETLRWDGGAKL